MKRVVLNRLSLGLFFAALLFVSTTTATTAPQAFDFTPPTPSEIAMNALFGEYDFDLHNRSSGWVLNGFYTREDGKWSRNWLTTKLQPGRSFRMMWSTASEDGDCVVPFRTTWDDYDKADTFSVDWCKGIKAIYLNDTSFTVDYK